MHWWVVVPLVSWADQFSFLNVKTYKTEFKIYNLIFMACAISVFYC